MDLQNPLSYSDLTYRDFDEVVDFLAVNMSTREPMSRMLHLTSEDYKEILPEAFTVWVQDGASVVARDVNSKKVVGCIMSAILTPEKAIFYERVFKAINSKVENLMKVLKVVESSVDLFRKYDVDLLLDIGMITVDPSYAGNGIGGRLISECERRGLTHACQIVTAQATNVSSQGLFKKAGYLTEAEIDYNSLKIQGQQVFDMKKSLGTYSVKIVARRLSSKSNNHCNE